MGRHFMTRRHAVEQAGNVHRYWDGKEEAGVRLAEVSHAELKAYLL